MKKQFVLLVLVALFAMGMVKDESPVVLNHGLSNYSLNIIQKRDYIEMLRIKYRKGFDIIRLLYEKNLELDHHFSSVGTFQNISALSNPHTYPEFSELEKSLKNRKKKNNIKLPEVLQTNPIMSSVLTITTALLGDNKSQVKQEEIDKIACIVDFSLRMNNDLKTIYYETEYLKLGNKKLLENCSKIFEHFTKPIGYKVPLVKCRKTDDWESLYEKLEEHLLVIKAQIDESDSQKMAKAYKLAGEMEFNVDRLVDFVNQYSLFIDQGQKYYKKFDIILTSYENNAACLDKLPSAYHILRKSIKEAIIKFDDAYNVTELKGTQLKELIYTIK